MDWKCEKCGKEMEIGDVFTICNGIQRKYNLAPLCETCADEILSEKI